ncbi:MAG TPA: phosphomannomutase/phosphoglucomutase [Candidatus Marinimicrobia bacterium]|jgi:phosphomannomutase/phosphoglucomutase|nr:phosphomannomutase/phosphoglucomutase [Candidatus Neomarinimicrobiota bacterium]MDP7217201.1 phosphomannomutase/phosphoglucomutase [Candidatus Neomarinimicrobiota bacterium]MDP7437591.1 phosphomannomutase/phosphoglucomutase [Candidatus Neomarinimicrobiota bacterium]MDP7653314.1 phosphomannomutase/phosphoglucomutase [Candidatus Neomarinimicrobiota bacterium]HJL74191.1 phosphomannomutase/phosphoglucomutase [Candidatus Neomarinimicrobiota bacterium]|tara:strand:+ start:3878 stop:5251 length:1374 start_codon:yes stop_codon:yes gene_type:complete
MINKYIFREYDIRGKVADDFPPDVVENLGKGFGSLVKRAGGQEISLSGDVRLTTPNLIEQFKTGLLSTGVDVINIGILPTPVNYFSMFELGVFGAVQITGSHNPPEFNGFKLSMERKAVFGEQIQDIRAIIEKEDYETGEGSEVMHNLKAVYKKMILDKINIERPIKVVMDCGNAAGAILAPEIFNNMENVELTEFYCDIDGTFPNHHPDPTVKENLADLICAMKTGQYDIGVAFDGDADRVGVVDETGEIIWADQLMSLFLPEVIQNEGEEILYDVKCSQALEEMIAKHGGTPVMWKTGHSLIKQRMHELGCRFGGEMSGHIFFADDYYGYDDAIYVAARAVQMLSRSKQALSEMVESLPKYYSTPEMRMAAENDEEKFRIAEEAVAYFTANYDCSTVDGVRIRFGDGWGLVRSSNTQPVIVCRFEADSHERMEEIKNLVLNKLSEFGTLQQDAGH